MNIKLVSTIHGPIAFSPGLPQGLTADIIPGATVLSAVRDFGTILFQEWRSDHFLLRSFSFSVLEKMTISCREEEEGWQSLVQLEGNMEYKVAGHASLHLYGGQFALMHVKNTDISATLHEHKKYHFWNTYFSPPFIEDFVFLFPQFLKELQQSVQKSFFYATQPRPVRRSVLESIRHHFESLYNPPLTAKFFEYKVRECLFTEFAQAYTERVAKENTRREKEKAAMAYDIITSDLRRHYSNKQLALLVEMNHVQLKKAFHNQYGMGMFSLLQKMRFEKAKELLKQGHPIKAVAGDVGYNHTTSFITEFRKYLGYTPLDLQKNRT